MKQYSILPGDGSAPMTGRRRIFERPLATVQGMIDWSRPAPVPEATGSGGGGAFGWSALLALLTGFAARRRIALDREGGRGMNGTHRDALDVFSRPARVFAGRLLGILAVLLSPVCLADPYLEVGAGGGWYGYSAPGEQAQARFEFEDYLDATMPGFGSQPFLALQDSVGGSTLSAGGPVGASLLVSLGYFRGEAWVGNAVSQAFGGAPAQPLSGGAGVEAYAGFSDTVVIDAPGLSGQPGSFTARFSVDHHMTVEGFVMPEAASNLLLEGAYVGAYSDFSLALGSEQVRFEAWISEDNFGGNQLDEYPDGEVQVLVPFVYGEPFGIQGGFYFEVDVFAGDHAHAQGRASAQFPGSFRWLGMSGLPEGATVQGSIDWSQPATVPEGSSGSSGGGGAFGWLALLALLAGRRVRSSTV